MTLETYYLIISICLALLTLDRIIPGRIIRPLRRNTIQRIRRRLDEIDFDQLEYQERISNELIAIREKIGMGQNSLPVASSDQVKSPDLSQPDEGVIDILTDFYSEFVNMAGDNREKATIKAIKRLNIHYNKSI